MAFVVATARQTIHVAAVAGSAAAAVARLAEQIKLAVEPRLGRGDLRSWFETTMDRVSQRFVTHMRLWTVAFSIVVAFALHLDSFRLLSQLAANPDARARLAGVSAAIERVADGNIYLAVCSVADAAVSPASALCRTPRRRRRCCIRT